MVPVFALSVSAFKPMVDELEGRLAPDASMLLRRRAGETAERRSRSSVTLVD